MVDVAVLPHEDAFNGMCSCGYTSKGWPTHDIAAERILQHKGEHEGGRGEDGLPAAPMELLSEFRARHGLVPSGNRAVFPAGAVVVGGEAKAEATATDGAEG